MKKIYLLVCLLISLQTFSQETFLTQNKVELKYVIQGKIKNGATKFSTIKWKEDDSNINNILQINIGELEINFPYDFILEEVFDTYTKHSTNVKLNVDNMLLKCELYKKKKDNNSLMLTLIIDNKNYTVIYINL